MSSIFSLIFFLSEIYQFNAVDSLHNIADRYIYLNE